ncbi:dihydroorotate dehydrogenase electron transfer subunit [Deltaproteobacteria bacterium PRO3]|nr:dihydroorotate dehydrogenase electron transfer subunit [Deltaproteobacteria bacterium PRO3]
MKDKLCQVAYHVALQEGYFRIGLETGWESFVPGQFGMLEVPRQDGVLLRRPFSFARQLGGTTEILYKVVGRGTEALSKVATGQSLRLLGPLGRGFEDVAAEGDRVGVAGGYGIAPFLQQAKRLKAQGRVLHLFYGARRAHDLLYLQELNELEVKLHITTEDGSQGERGRVTELLAKVYAESSPAVVWSCGPLGLLHAVQSWALPRGVPCELSVEETMGCGTGVCLGCVVKDQAGRYRRACIEGPVFAGECLKF